jgi:hypothetical protein
MWAASVPLQGVGASIEELALSMVVYPEWDPAYPNFVSLTSGTHHIWAHLSVTQSQEKLGLESQRIRLPSTL